LLKHSSHLESKGLISHKEASPMKLRAACLVVSFLSLLLSLAPLTVAQTAAETASALPRLVRFSGTVKDLNGNPLTGVVGITFALYSEQTGGAALWLETQNVTADRGGHYVALLGSTKPDGLRTDLFTSEQARWVDVQVSGQSEQPRVLLVSAPYALKAGDAETVGGLPASAFILANGGSPAVASTKTAAAPASNAASKNSSPANPDVTGKGTIDYIPMWDTTSDIVNSIIFQKSSEIGINTTTPAATLDVNGKTDIRDTLTLYPKSTDNTLGINGTAFKIDQAGKVTFITGQTFPGAGTITGVTTASGSGLSGGGTSGTLSLKVPSAGITNTMLANSKITLNASAAGGLAAPGAMTLGSTNTIGLKSCSANQILQYSGSAWGCATPGTGKGTVTSVGTGLGLKGGPVTGAGTLTIDTSIVPQLNVANTFTTDQNVAGNIGASGSVTALSAILSGSDVGVSSSGTEYGGIFSSNGGHIGLYGYNTNDCDLCVGVEGYAFGATRTIGVIGGTASSQGVGVYGQMEGASKTGANRGSAGVWGIREDREEKPGPGFWPLPTITQP
jgi:hypothetical protein